MNIPEDLESLIVQGAIRELAPATRKIGDPIGIHKNGEVIVGRVCGFEGETAFAPARPIVKVQTPHGTVVTIGCFYVCLLSPAGLEWLEALEKDVELTAISDLHAIY